MGSTENEIFENLACELTAQTAQAAHLSWNYNERVVWILLRDQIAND
jgi:hypothetical protein